MPQLFHINDLLIIACIFIAGSSSKMWRLLPFFNVSFLFCMQNSSTYWEGKADMESLQRIYGISFPDTKMLKEWEKFQEEAKSRDHRKIGRVRQLSQYCMSKVLHGYNPLIESILKSAYTCCHNQDVNFILFSVSCEVTCFSLEHPSPKINNFFIF